jgi:hypothetical protein
LIYSRAQIKEEEMIEIYSKHGDSLELRKTLSVTKAKRKRVVESMSLDGKVILKPGFQKLFEEC